MLNIADYTYSVGTPTIIGRGNVNIGKFCSIGAMIRFVTWSHHMDYFTTYPFANTDSTVGWTAPKGHPIVKDINIGNDVWIGDSAIILGGVTVGDGAVISAGSLVHRNVKPYSVGGNPAGFLFYRFDQKIINLLLNLKWWDLPEDIIKNNVKTLCSNNYDGLLKLNDLKNEIL